MLDLISRESLENYMLILEIARGLVCSSAAQQ